MPWHCRRIRVETAKGSVTNRHICHADRWIKRDAEHGTIRKNEIVTGHVHPIRLTSHASSKIETNPNVGVICTGDRNGLKFRRVFDLIDERAIAERLLGHVLGRRIVGDVPTRRAGRIARGRFPNSGRADNQVTASAATRTGGRTIVAARNAAVENIVRQNKTLCVAEPSAGDITPSRAGRSATLVHKGLMATGHVSAIFCMLGMVMLPAAGSVAALFAFCLLGAVSYPGVFAIPQIIAGPAVQGRWVGVQNAIGNVAGLIAPAITAMHFSRIIVSAPTNRWILRFLALIIGRSSTPWGGVKVTAAVGSILARMSAR